MNTYPIDKGVSFAVTDVFLSIFGPVLVAAIVLFVASILNIL